MAKTEKEKAPPSERIPQEGAGGIIQESDVTRWREDDNQEAKVGEEVTYDLGKDKGAEYKVEGTGV